MIKRAVLLYLGLACVIPLQGHGANPIDTQEQLDRARANREAREARLGEERYNGNIYHLIQTVRHQDLHQVL